MFDLWFASVYLHRHPRKSVLKSKSLEPKYQILSQVLICLCLLCPSISRKTCCCAITGKSVNQHICWSCISRFCSFLQVAFQDRTLYYIHFYLYLCYSNQSDWQAGHVLCRLASQDQTPPDPSSSISTKENLTNLTSRESSNSQKVVLIMLV